ncbi:hypothetical protein [Streptomonospora sediminis]
MTTETSESGAEFIEKVLHQLRLEPADSQWVGRAGDFVVVEGEDKVSLTTPANWRGGGFYYPVVPGTHPVYAVAVDSGEPGEPEYRVTHLFLRFAPWEQVADAHWTRVNDSVGAEVEGCVGLWTEQSELAASRRWGGRHHPLDRRRDGNRRYARRAGQLSQRSR